MQQKNITLIGKSDKFYSLIKSIYPNHQLKFYRGEKSLKKIMNTILKERMEI